CPACSASAAARRTHCRPSTRPVDVADPVRITPYSPQSGEKPSLTGFGPTKTIRSHLAWFEEVNCPSYPDSQHFSPIVWFQRRRKPPGEQPEGLSFKRLISGASRDPSHLPSRDPSLRPSHPSRQRQPAPPHPHRPSH